MNKMEEQEIEAEEVLEEVKDRPREVEKYKEIKELLEEEKDVESDCDDSFTNYSEDEEQLTNNDSSVEAPLTDAEVQELIDEFFAVESKAAKAQESLEKESIAQVESEVRAEMAQNLHGDDLEAAVATEMKTFLEEWEEVLDDMEVESALLLEQLDGAGIDLPSLYKYIENQAPNGCFTDSWSKWTHWVGSQITNEVTESITKAENYLKTCRPVRSQHGRLLEEGASGYLGRKLAIEGNMEIPTEHSEKYWSTFNELLLSLRVSEDSTSFGSRHWASVYLASTPQQAVKLGLKLPGIHEVEEIDEVVENPSDPFYADAIAHEKEIDLSEEQKINFKKVKEEEDVNITRKLLLQLKRRRRTRSQYQDLLHKKIEFCRSIFLDEGSHLVSGEGNYSETREGVHHVDNNDSLGQSLRGGTSGSLEAPSAVNNENVIKPNASSSDMDKYSGFKRSRDDQDLKIDSKRRQTLIIDSDGEVIVEEFSTNMFSESNEIEQSPQPAQRVDVIDVDAFSSPSPSGFHFRVEETNEYNNALGIGDEVSLSSDRESDLSGCGVDVRLSSKKRHMRRILDDAELGEETKHKVEIEKVRQENLKSLQGKSWSKSFASCSPRGTEEACIEMLGDATKGYVVNVAREENEAAVRIPCSLSAKLKAHQVSGIRFMWENIIQSFRMVKSGDKGLGCILAHTMGLGKTFQVIAFLYTAMRSVDLGLRTALIVTPVNVLHNWRQEFKKWKPSELKPLRIFMLEDAPREKRGELLAKWRAKGGVFLIGYAAFRNLALGKHVKDKNVALEICNALQNGPDILVCDEAHMIKNTRADTTQALKQVKCQRRIALTGSPLHNNLMEYYCMVDFVREGFLGSSHEFRNRYQNPIENGQHTNSTSDDVKIMNLRSHILYKQLKGFVQRMDINVVKNDLPPKTVFVIGVKLSPLQRKLYKRFLDVHGFTSHTSEKSIRSSFFAGYQTLAQIWNHPGLLHLAKEQRDNLKREDAVENYLSDDSSSAENMDCDAPNGEKTNSKNDIACKKTDYGFFQEEVDWWKDLVQDKVYKQVDYSGKMVLLLDILSMSMDMGDKALVFSQSLTTLNLIELFLSKVPQKGRESKYWKRGKDWYRLDGSTAGSERQKLVERFNEPKNKRVKCTLISTRAGSLGINLPAANRVILMDGSWNPTNDLQAIYRVWRYGQDKPVYAYRLMAHGTMEEKIYKRQVTKEGLAARVVDRQQIHRTMSKEEMLHLFDFFDDENKDPVSEKAEQGVAWECGGSSFLKKSLPLSQGSSCSDRFMENLISRHYPRWICTYHEHEILLQENKEEKLSKEEQDMAWEVFRRSIKWEEVQSLL